MGRLIFVILCLVLVGCGSDMEKKGGQPADLGEAPMDPVERARYLRSFSLLNEFGEKKPPTVDGIYPFATLLKLPASGKVMACTATHITEDLVATNAHCVVGIRSIGPTGFYLVYYNRQGVQKNTPILERNFLGSRDADDVVILKIPREAGAEWHIARGGIRSTAATIGQRPPASLDVTIWALDPAREHSEVLRKYGGAAMIFAPKRCKASRTTPLIYGITQSDDRVNLIENTPVNQALHTFIDACDQAMINGNSGSLITVGRDLSQMLGVYHWGIGLADNARDRFKHFEYEGNDGIKRVLGQPPVNGDFFGVGSVLENLVIDGIGPLL